MSDNTSENQPPSFDNEQARQFYRTATNSQRLPKKYWPDKNVEVDLFDAAVIAQFEAVITRQYEASQLLSSEESLDEMDPGEIRRRELAKGVFRYALERKEWATEYVQGFPIEDISVAGRNNPEMQKEGAFSYVLQVAKVGAKEIKRLHTEEQLIDIDGLVSASGKMAGEQLVTKQQPLEILSEYKDLDDRIRKLYHKQRIDRESAQALMLLLELQQSTASPERQIRALFDIRCEIERKMVTWMFDQESASVSEKNLHLEKGIGYLQRIIGRPRRRVSGVRPHRLVKEIDAEIGEGANQLQVRDHVYSHISYALEKLYHL